MRGYAADTPERPTPQSQPPRKEPPGKGRAPISWKGVAVTGVVGSALLAFMLYVRKQKEQGVYICLRGAGVITCCTLDYKLYHPVKT